MYNVFAPYGVKHKLTNELIWAGALVKWFWETTHVREVVGSNPGAVYWTDITFLHIDLL